MFSDNTCIPCSIPNSECFQNRRPFAIPQSSSDCIWQITSVLMQQRTSLRRSAAPLTVCRSHTSSCARHYQVYTGYSMIVNLLATVVKLQPLTANVLTHNCSSRNGVLRGGCARAVSTWHCASGHRKRVRGCEAVQGHRRRASGEGELLWRLFCRVKKTFSGRCDNTNNCRFFFCHFGL